MKRFRWVGWFDGTEDCEPAEPGKEWIEIQLDYHEVAIIVLRTEPFKDDPETLKYVRKIREERADIIVDALNFVVESNKATNVEEFFDTFRS